MEFVLSPTLVNKRFRVALNKKQRYQIYFGGSSSSKSYSIWTFTVFWILEGRSILAIRENDAHIKKSIFSEVTKAISRNNLSKYFRINLTDKTIVSLISNGSMSTSGVKDVEKLKSITPIKGAAFDTVICEEATELNPFQFNQILLRQRGKTKFPKRAILLFNPILRSHWIYERFFKPIEEHVDFNRGREILEYEDDELFIHKSTYLDNEHLEEEEKKTLEDMLYHSPEMHNVYALGNFGTFAETVYSDNVVYEDINFDNIRHLPWRIGIDHGFNDAQTCVISKYDEQNNTIYIVDAIDHRKMLADVFAAKVKDMFNKCGVSLSHIIYADSSDPRANEVLIGQGLRVKKAIKGAGSKFAGIMWLKTKTWVVNDKLNNIKQSVASYVWKVDKNGNTLDDTEHDGSDLLDAIRYAYELDARGKKGIVAKNVKY